MTIDYNHARSLWNQRTYRRGKAVGNGLYIFSKFYNTYLPNAHQTFVLYLCPPELIGGRPSTDQLNHGKIMEWYHDGTVVIYNSNLCNRQTDIGFIQKFKNAIHEYYPYNPLQIISMGSAPNCSYCYLWNANNYYPVNIEDVYGTLASLQLIDCKNNYHPAITTPPSPAPKPPAPPPIVHHLPIIPINYDEANSPFICGHPGGQNRKFELAFKYNGTIEAKLMKFRDNDVELYLNDILAIAYSKHTRNANIVNSSLITTADQQDLKYLSV